MIGEIFTLILLNPLVNLLVLLSHLLFGSFGLAIIAFTILIRAATFPLTRAPGSSPPGTTCARRSAPDARATRLASTS